MWFSVVCTLTDNDTRHHSGQTVVDSRDALCKWAGYLYESDFPFKNVCKLAQHEETIWKNVWEKSNDGYSPIRLQTTINHISICFSSHYQRQRKCFFQSASWKRHCTTYWRRQRGMDSYWQQHISQSDYKISSHCGKKWNRRYSWFEITGYTLLESQIPFFRTLLVWTTRSIVFFVQLKFRS